MEIALIWVVSMIVSAAIGNSKGEGGLGFLVGLIFGPLGIVFALLSRGDRMKCPSCAEWMKRRALVCPHCGRERAAAAAAG